MTEDFLLGLDDENPNVNKTPEYMQSTWPLPHMFGEETYAKYNIGIKDPRYADEISDLGKRLNKALGIHQRIDREWRKAFSNLRSSEYARDALPSNAKQRVRDKLDRMCQEQLQTLLATQKARDLCVEKIESVKNRISAIANELTREKAFDDFNTTADSQMSIAELNDDLGITSASGIIYKGFNPASSRQNPQY